MVLDSIVRLHLKAENAITATTARVVSNKAIDISNGNEKHDHITGGLSGFGCHQTRKPVCEHPALSLQAYGLMENVLLVQAKELLPISPSELLELVACAIINVDLDSIIGEIQGQKTRSHMRTLSEQVEQLRISDPNLKDAMREIKFKKSEAASLPGTLLKATPEEQALPSTEGQASSSKDAGRTWDE